MKPIFILSLPRSGSTLLQRILAKNSDIVTSSEPWFLLPLFYSSKKYGVIAEYSHRASYNAIQDLIADISKTDGKALYYQSIGKGASKIYDHLCKNNEKYFLDKTPRYYLIIEELKMAFPTAKFIFLFRNPLDVFTSVLETWSNNSLSIEKNYVDLYKGPHSLVEGYKSLKDRCFSLKYENVIVDANNTIKELCNYLEIDFKSQMTGEFTSVKLAGSKGDPGILKYDQIITNNSDKYQKVINSNFRKRYFLKYLNHLGPSTLSGMGYDIDELKKSVREIPVSALNFDIRSRFQHMKSKLVRTLDYQPFRVKLENRLLNKENFQRYS